MSMTCKSCKWARWPTGKGSRSTAGQCAYPIPGVELPDLPVAVPLTHIPKWPPVTMGIWKDETRECDTWGKK